MPDIICDTPPLQRLHRGGVLDVLASLYEKIVVPEAVAAEIEEGRASGVDLPDLGKLPWIEVRKVRNPALVSLDTGLGPAEREAVALAMSTPGAILIMDDALARRHVKLLRQPATGTIGVLLKAKQMRHVTSVGSVLDRMNSNGFRLSLDTRTTILAWAGES